MRMMMHVTIPVEPGNRAALAGTLGSTIQKLLEPMHAESAYFTATESGERSGFIVFRLKDSSESPGIAEPFFLAFNAKLTFWPVMNLQDLGKAAPGIEKAVQEYRAAAS